MNVIKLTSVALLSILFLMTTSCSKNDLTEKDKNNSLDELEQILRSKHDKGTLVIDDFTDDETGLTGTLYPAGGYDEISEDLLIVDEQPDILSLDSNGFITWATMTVKIEEEGTINEQGYWSCSGNRKGNCIRIGGVRAITIAWSW